MMKQKYMPFVAAASRSKLTGPDRTFSLAAAVAASVADFAAMPSAPSNNPGSFYSANAAQSIRTLVSEFNENVTFDIRLATDLARKFWMTRYNALYERRVHQICKGDFFCGYFNVSREFSPNEIEMLNLLTEDIGALEQSVRKIIGDCMDAEKIKDATTIVTNTGAVPAATAYGVNTI